jgi:hypothetical protein
MLEALEAESLPEEGWVYAGSSSVDLGPLASVRTVRAGVLTGGKSRVFVANKDAEPPVRPPPPPPTPSLAWRGRRRCAPAAALHPAPHAGVGAHADVGAVRRPRHAASASACSPSQPCAPATPSRPSSCALTVPGRRLEFVKRLTVGLAVAPVAPAPGRAARAAERARCAVAGGRREAGADGAGGD